MAGRPPGAGRVLAGAAVLLTAAGAVAKHVPTATTLLYGGPGAAQLGCPGRWSAGPRC
ncbi:hypothetical protein HBB16_03450 [Pseudonocardia sp. MCCB 268]|nr:hypothetical protein [Pseudonocardia cytotoxica]